MALILLAGLLLAAPAEAADVCWKAIGSDAPHAEGILVGREGRIGNEEVDRALRGIQKRGPCEVGLVLRVARGDERRTRIRMAGREYEGLLVSDRTRIPGLISIYDIKPTIDALEAGRKPPITAQRGGREQLIALDERLDDLQDSRMPAGLGLVAVVAVLTAIAALGRSGWFGRSALLAVPVALATALSLSALEITKPGTAVPILLGVAALGALGLGLVLRGGYALAAGLLAVFPLYLVVLAVSQETSSLAVIGPQPENGGRFYGFNNQLETLVLVPAFLGAALLGPALLPVVALLALIVVGASFAGADGGGVVVLLAGFLFLWLRLRAVPLTRRNLALAGVGVVVLGLVVVGIDAALGGESHVTRSIGGGPDQLASDIVDRLQASANGVFSSWHSTVVIGVSIPVLVWLALRRPRYLVLDALLVALAVSLLVNDAPREVSGYGALCAAALRFWWEAAEGVE